MNASIRVVVVEVGEIRTGCGGRRDCGVAAYVLVCIGNVLVRCFVFSQ